MFDYNKKFISLGIEYNETLFKSVSNRKIFNNTLYPPTKPIEGGLWGSEKRLDNEFVSSWHKFIIKKLNPTLFNAKLINKSTVFSIIDSAKVLNIESFEHIKLEKSIADGQMYSNIPLRTVKVAGHVPHQFKEMLYIDFESSVNYYDAIYVSEEFVSQVDWVLHEYDWRIKNNIKIWDEIIIPEVVFKASFFEDWNVDSILILNPKCIKISSIENPK